MKQNDKKTYFSIKFSRTEIKHLLAALDLSIIAENWCDSLSSASVCGGDCHSIRWVSMIRLLIKDIETKTKIKERCSAHAGSEELKFISKIIDKECIEIENEYEKVFGHREK